MQLNEWLEARKLLKIITCYILTCFIITAFLYLWKTSMLDAWAGFIALIATASSCMQFIPQILKTWKLKVDDDAMMIYL